MATHVRTRNTRPADVQTHIIIIPERKYPWNLYGLLYLFQIIAIFLKFPWQGYDIYGKIVSIIAKITSRIIGTALMYS